jgi:membrane-bound metal-dependent hydrolase YbcI (DUF457 family)
MPITPFHFGPGALLHAVAPKKISFIAFCTANVLMDVEPLYYMLTQQWHLHRFFHTLIGVTLIVLASCLLFLSCLKFSKRFYLPNTFNWQHLNLSAVAIGAALGSYSHIVLDSIMHSDMQPLAPWSDKNPLLHLIALDTLHLACLVAGVLGILLLMTRTLLNHTRKK